MWDGFDLTAIFVPGTISYNALFVFLKIINRLVGEFL